MNNRSLKILVVDDNRSAADALARVLSKKGHELSTAYDGASAIASLTDEPPDVVLTDLKMEPIDGMAVLRAARACRPPLEVVVFTAYGAVDIAVEAMRLGARDFLTKPVTVEQVELRLRQIQPESIEVQESPPTPAFIAESPSSKLLLASLSRAAKVPSPVLLQGEIGSGRGFAALTIHSEMEVDEPFEIWDVARRTNWPTRGTVMLPNIDDLPDDLQRKLARELHHIPPDVRIIASSGPSGQQLVAEEKLRPELYYSVAVMVIDIPPLRERKQDIIPLLRVGLNHFSAEFNRPKPEISKESELHLLQHSWPGNVRELLNLCERAVVIGRNAFDINSRPSSTQLDSPKVEPGFCLSTYLEGVEKKILTDTLKQTGGDRNEVCRLLRVERNTLRYKLKKYGLLA
jgi:DNA-binding NtrC family response regulator